MQECKAALCFGDVVAVSRDDSISVAADALSVKKREAKEAKVHDGLEKNRNGEVAELHFGIAGDVLEGSGCIVAVWGKRSTLEECWRVAHKGQIVGDSDLSEGVGKDEESNVKGVEDDRERFEGGGDLVEH